MEGAANLFSQEREAEQHAEFAETVEVGSEIRTAYGNAAPSIDSRLLPFDGTQAIRMNAKNPVAFGASSNRRLAVNEARELLVGLMARHGVHTKVENVQLAFLNAVLLAHVKNSASTLAPDRAEFFIGSEADPQRLVLNYYADVVDILGDDTRRFFRTYADYTRKMLSRLLSKRASLNEQVRADIADVDQVAHARGMSRHPELCFDTAEDCTGLSPNIRDLLASSKASVLSKGVNAVDNRRVIRPMVAGSPETFATANSSSAYADGPDY